MKKIILIVIIVALGFQTTKAQEVFAINDSGPFGMRIDNGFLYVVETFSNQIVRYDISDPSVPPEVVIENASAPADIEIIDGTLYISNYDVETTGFISAFNLDDPFPGTAETITTTVGETIFIDIDDNGIMYIPHRDSSTIVTLDLSDSSPSEEVYGSLESVYNISIDANRMILSTDFPNTSTGLYYQANIEDPFDPVQIYEGGPTSSYITGSFVYFYDLDTEQFFRINLTDPDFTPELLFDYPTFDSSYSIAIEDNIIYASVIFSEIITFDFNALSTDEFASNEISIFPNPAQDVINITNENGFEFTDASLVNILGSVNKVNIINNSIDISLLASGVYMLNLVTEKGVITKKIIKQ